MADTRKPEERGASGFQKLFFVLLVLVLVGSVAARAALLSQREKEQASSGAALQGKSYLASSAPDSVDADAGPIEKALPYVTEGSLFALIGFALGYATRKIFKLALIVIALAFVGTQLLVHYGAAEVEWGSVVDRVNRAILNLRHDESITEFLTKRVPSAGALLVGYFLGFRRG